MNRTENFIAMLSLAMLSLAMLAEHNAGTIYGWINLFAAALFFVAWFGQMRAQPRHINNELLECLKSIYNWTEHKDSAWAKRAKAAIDNATRVDG